jgi:hypothetical protein
MAQMPPSPAWQSTTVSLVQRMLPVLWGGLWGCFFTILLDRINPAGDLLKVFVPVLSGLTGAGLGIWGSRSISERNAERERYRQGYTAFLRLQGGLQELSTIHNGIVELKKLREGKGTPTKDDMQRLGNEIGVAWLTSAVYFNDPPKFDAWIESDADQEEAFHIVSRFAWLSRFVASESLIEKYHDDAHALMTYLSGFYMSGNIEDCVRRLKESESHFDRKVGQS